MKTEGAKQIITPPLPLRHIAIVSFFYTSEC